MEQGSIRRGGLRRLSRPFVLAALLLASTVFLVSSPSWAKTRRPIVAVFNIDDKGAGLAQQMLARLSDYLASSLAATGEFQVIPRDQLKQRLVEQKKQSYRECYDQTCQIEIGKELAAQKTVSTMVMKLGSRCTVTSVLYDLRTATSEGGASADGPCTEDGVVATIKEVLTRLIPKRAASGAGAVRLKGGLLIKSEPGGASVWLDGIQMKGVTPMTLEDLTAEEHLLIVRKGLSRHVTMVRVRPDQFTTIEVELRRAGVRLSVISSPPEAQILLDGKVAGSTPRIIRDVPIGQHTIELRREGYITASRTINLEEDAGPRKLSIQLELAGVLHVLSSPPGAAVIIGGKRLGRTPVKLHLPGGEHAVTVSSPVHKKYVKKVVVSPGEETRMTAVLVLTQQEQQRLSVVWKDARRLKQDRIKHRSRTVWGYTLLTTGLVLAAASGTLFGVGAFKGHDAHDKYSDAHLLDQRQDHRGDVESARTMLVAGAVLGGAAGAALCSSIILFALRSDSPEDNGYREAKIPLGLWTLRGGAALGFGGQF